MCFRSFFAKLEERMSIDNELIDRLLKDYQKPEDIIGENGLLRQLTKGILERAPQGSAPAVPKVNGSRI